MKKIALLLCLATTMVASSQVSVNIVPKPQELTVKTGTFTISPSTLIVAPDAEAAKSAQFLNDYLKKFFGITLTVAPKGKAKNAIVLTNLKTAGKTEGAYSLTVDKSGVKVSGHNAAGVFYGIQTLIQLLPVETAAALTIPQLTVQDSPRFGYRGMHLDVGRHFYSVDFVKRFIDFLALHKLNTFHWHLTEDQGWRIEIKQYPALTSVGSKRNGTIIGRYPGKGNDNKPYGGYYTQDQIREVVKYATDRYVEVIPEIELPGHSSAAIAAYPWLSCFPNRPTSIPSYMVSLKSVEEQQKGRVKLVQETWGVFDDVFCAGKDTTFTFLQNVLDEVVGLFPSNYVHIGGDECPKAHWKQCPACQKRKKDLGLKDEHELQSWFIQRIEKYLNAKGKTLIGWDEILEGGLAPNAQVMSWRGEKGGIDAAKEKHFVIMTPNSHVYFDHKQTSREDSVTIGGYSTVQHVYSYEPVPASLTGEEAKFVRGAQANVWTEYMNNEKKVEYMIFPRMSALSEVLWSPKESRNWADFEKRLLTQFKRFDLWKANYSKAYFDPNSTKAN